MEATERSERSTAAGLCVVLAALALSAVQAAADALRDLVSFLAGGLVPVRQRALHRALARGDVAAAKRVLRAGGTGLCATPASLDYVHPRTGDTVLHFAARSPASLAALLDGNDLGAAPEASLVNFGLETCLHVACRVPGDAGLGSVEWLLEWRRASPERAAALDAAGAEDVSGATPLDAALAASSWGCARALAKDGGLLKCRQYAKSQAALAEPLGEGSASSSAGGWGGLTTLTDGLSAAARMLAGAFKSSAEGIVTGLTETSVHRLARKREVTYSTAALQDADAIAAHRNRGAGASAEVAGASRGDGGTCCVCYLELEDADLAVVPVLACSHACCATCWRSHLTARLDEGDVRGGVRCPGEYCTQVLTDTQVGRLLPLDTLKRYTRAVADHHVATDAKVRWCPSPGCGEAVALTAAGRDFVGDAAIAGRGVTVRCGSGHSFCWGCGNAPHEPATCAQLAQWSSLVEGVQAAEQDAAEAWMNVNTQPCPKCHSPIQKNDGCNHMSCRCGHQFCWACLGDWSEHSARTGGSYFCNIAAADERRARSAHARPTRQVVVELEADKRLWACVLKCRAHETNQAEERAVVDHACSLVRDPTIELTLRTALDQLAVCHAVLRHSYIFGFYLAWSVQRAYYKTLQQRLEEATRKLEDALVPRELRPAARQLVSEAAQRDETGAASPSWSGRALQAGLRWAASSARQLWQQGRMENTSAAIFLHAHALDSRAADLASVISAAKDDVDRLFRAVRSGVVQPGSNSLQEVLRIAAAQVDRNEEPNRL